MATKIVTCDCVNEGQDKLHGKGKRVANAISNGKGHRCTVCKKIH